MSQSLLGVMGVLKSPIPPPTPSSGPWRRGGFKLLGVMSVLKYPPPPHTPSSGPWRRGGFKLLGVMGVLILLLVRHHGVLAHLLAHLPSQALLLHLRSAACAEGRHVARCCWDTCAHTLTCTHANTHTHKRTRTHNRTQTHNHTHTHSYMARLSTRVVTVSRGGPPPPAAPTPSTPKHASHRFSEPTTSTIRPRAVMITVLKIRQEHA